MNNQRQEDYDVTNVNWHPESAGDLPDWAWPKKDDPEEKEAFRRWLNKFDADPFEPTPRTQLLHFAEIRGIEVPPYSPKIDQLPSLLTDAFSLKGPINGGTLLWVLKSKGNYNAKGVERLIEDSGFQIAAVESVLMMLHSFGMTGESEVKPFEFYLSSGMVPRGETIIAYQNLNY